MTRARWDEIWRVALHLTAQEHEDFMVDPEHVDTLKSYVKLYIDAALKKAKS